MIIEYLISFFKVMESDRMPDFPDPDPPADLGSALTQEEIDFVKTLKKDMEERFVDL